MSCQGCQKRDDLLAEASDLIPQLTQKLQESNQAIEILNLKIKEQEATIMKLNNGLMKAAKINNVKGKLCS